MRLTVQIPDISLAICIGLAGICTLSASCREPSSRSGALFEDATVEAGLSAFRHETGAVGRKWMPETYGAGGGFVDYDDDGWIDILLVSGGKWTKVDGGGPSALVVFRNNKDGTFSDATASAGLGNNSGYGFGVTAADYDNDGDADIFLSTLGRNLFFRNEKGTFREAARDVGLGDTEEWSTAALFFDADRDGWIDLYVGNYVPWTPETDVFCTSDGSTKDYCMPHQYPGQAGRFYRNTGEGTFIDHTVESGMAGSPGKTLGVAELDFNADGLSDLVVSNDTRRNMLYKNRGNGTFEEIGVASGIAYDRNGRARAGMGVDVGVVDISREPTIFIGNFSEEMVGVYRHMGNGVFVDRGPASGIGQASLMTLTFGLMLFDADLDADLDLLLANGHIMQDVELMQQGLTYRQRPQLFLNDGAASFGLADASAGNVLARPLVARGAAYADYDRDGDLDVLITENGGPVHLWRNTTDPRSNEDIHSVQVHLESRAGNRDALGARIRIVASGFPTQERRVHTGGSYLSQSEVSPIFGLGGYSRIDTLKVFWPSSREDVFEGIDVDQEILIVEGDSNVDSRRLNVR